MTSEENKTSKSPWFYQLRSDTLDLGPGRKIIGQFFVPALDRGSYTEYDAYASPIGVYPTDADYVNVSTDRGRVLYVSPEKTDTVYYNYPDKFIQGDEVAIPIGTTKDQEKAKKHWYQWLEWSKPYNSNAAELRRNELQKHQQGGSIQSEAQKQQQQQFIQFLMQEAEQEGVTIQSQEDLKNYIQKLGEEGIKEKQQKFLMLQQSSQQSTQQNGAPVAAKQGSKLNYIKELKGICPEGYLAKGGKCEPCEAKKGKKMNAIESFRAQRKNK